MVFDMMAERVCNYNPVMMIFPGLNYKMYMLYKMYKILDKMLEIRALLWKTPRPRLGNIKQSARYCLKLCFSVSIFFKYFDLGKKTKNI